MNSYPTEVRTPPLPLVAFVGVTDVHKEIGTYFSQVLRPPLVSVGVAEASGTLLARLFGPEKGPPKPFSTPDGILKADWILKQRQRRAAVALAFVLRSEVEGDPASWMRMLNQLKTVRQATSARSAGMMVVVVHEGPPTELPPDRVAALCNNLNLEPTCLYSFDRDVLTGADKKQRQEADLKPLGKLVLEQANAYYLNQAHLLKDKQVELARSLGSCPAEINVQVAFKLAILAEFRQDWLSAVTQYQTAYAALRSVQLGQPVSVQRHAEVTRVAEVVHFKTTMLLLHQQRAQEALDAFRAHVALFGKLPDGFPAAAAAAHWGWLARQYTAAAEMVAGRVDEATLAANKDCQPGQLAVAAARLAVRRRAAVEEARRGRAGRALAIDAAAVKKGPYVGQMVLKSESGASKDLTDAEYCLFLEAEETRANQSQPVLEALAGALAHFKEARYERVRAQLGCLMAAEHVANNNLISARKLLLQVAHTYRRDGWDGPLLSALLQLRDCSQRLKLGREAICYGLELSALPAFSAAHGAPAAAATASSALASLLSGEADRRTSIMKSSGGGMDTAQSGSDASSQISSPRPVLDGAVAADGLDASSAAHAASPTHAQQQQQQHGLHYEVEFFDLRAAQRLAAKADVGAAPPNPADMLLRHRQQDFGWWQCIVYAGGFMATTPDTALLHYCFALHNRLPVALPIHGLLLGVADEAEAWTETAYQGLPPSPSSSTQQESTAAAAAALAALQLQERQQSSATATTSSPGSGLPAAGSSLAPGHWQHFHVAVSPKRAGRIQVERLVLQLASHASVTIKLGSFPPGHAMLGNAVLSGRGEWPFKSAAGVRAGVHAVHVAHVGHLPKLQLHASGLALTGEFAPVTVSVTVDRALAGGTVEVVLKTVEEGGAAAMTLLALQDGALKALPQQETNQLPLPPVAAGSSAVLKLWARSPQPVTARLGVTLLCPAPVTASVDVAFEEPFEHAVQLFSETNTHTLVSPSHAYSQADRSVPVPLVIGQAVMGQVMVRGAQEAAVELVDAEVQIPASSGLQLVNQVNDQLHARPVVLQCGGVHTFLLHVCPTHVTPTPFSLGKLQLRWRRAASAPLQPATASMAGVAARQAADPLGSSAPVAGAWGEGVGDGNEGMCPPEETVTTLDLPSVVVQEGLLSVKVVSPPHITSGIAFPFTLQIRNPTAEPQEVQVAVQETQAFMFTGDKQQNVTIMPRDTSSIVWVLVAHANGLLPLPAVRVAAMRFACATITQGLHIHVLPF